MERFKVITNVILLSLLPVFSVEGQISILSVEKDIDFSKKHFKNKFNFVDSVGNIDGLDLHTAYLNQVYPHFRKSTSFIEARFDEAANFAHTKFHKVDFSFARFHSPAVFAGAQFDSLVFFHNTQFDSSVDFDGSTFQFNVQFMLAKFYSKANFEYAKFRTNRFWGTEFKSRVSFANANFDSTAEFLGVRFNSVDFENAQFKSRVDFMSARFDSLVSFRNAKFKKAVSFISVKLPAYLDFRYVSEIANEIDLTSAEIEPTSSKKCKIALYGSDIDKIRIDLKLFDIWFPEPENNYQQRISTYEKLLKKFKEEGFLESFQTLDIEYREYKYLHKGDTFLNCFQKNWWNYGYNKEWVLFRWTLGFFLFFTVVNLFLFSTLNQKVYNVDFLRGEVSHKKDNVDKVGHITGGKHRIIQLIRYISDNRRAFLLHLMRALIYTAIIFFGLKMDLDKFNNKQLTRGGKDLAFLGYVLLIYVIYFIGLFCIGFLVNIIFTG